MSRIPVCEKNAAKDVRESFVNCRFRRHSEDGFGVVGANGLVHKGNPDFTSYSGLCADAILENQRGLIDDAIEMRNGSQNVRTAVAEFIVLDRLKDTSELNNFVR